MARRQDVDAQRTVDGASAPATFHAAHPIMFWLLVSMALAVFAPCVLLPVWIETESVLANERDMETRLSALREQYRLNEIHIQALENDPLVSERLIRRELNVLPDPERMVQLPPEQLASVRVRLPEDVMSPAPPAEITPPEWMSAIRGWLPSWPWRRLFATDPNRTVLLLMAGGLLVSAFLLYAPRRVR